MKPHFEELDFRPTPLGDLILRRRRMVMLDDLIVYEVLLGNGYLMSSLFHVVEEALADLSLAEVHGEQLDIVVGGLGLGYTAVAALRDSRVSEMLVIDVMQPVIEWHRSHLVPLGETLTADPRCRLVHGDFFTLAATPEIGFDPDLLGRKFHAVLLDIDHSTTKFLDEDNSNFYSTDGLTKLAAQLHPGGIFAMWSDDAPDDEFGRALAKVFTNPRAVVVPFFNPLLDQTSESTVYIASK